MPGAKRLYQKIMRYDPYILSAYSGRDPSSRNGKLKWLAKNTDFKRRNILLVKEVRNNNMQRQVVNQMSLLMIMIRI